MNFAEQYKHPEWQKKRLESLNDAGFTCATCGDKESHLHVHHKRYVKGRLIWEYPISELEVLCESCHEDAHAQKDELQHIIAMLPTDAIPEIISVVSGYCQKVVSPAQLFIPDNPDMCHTEYCGKIAGTVANKLSMNGLFDLLMAIETTPRGGSFTFTIPNPKGFS